MERLIVFDMDGTLYGLDAVMPIVYETQIAFLRLKMNVSRDEAVSYFNDNCVFPFVSEKSRSATRLFQESGFDLQEWNEFREARFPFDAIAPNAAVSMTMIEKFRQLGPCVLVTSNSQKNVEQILDKISIRPTVFNRIVSNDSTSDKRPFEKLDAFRRLLDDYSTQPHQAFSIGDRFPTDIEPMLSLGGNGVLVSTPESLQRVLMDFSAGTLATCDAYRYFPAMEAIDCSCDKRRTPCPIR